MYTTCILTLKNIISPKKYKEKKTLHTSLKKLWIFGGIMLPISQQHFFWLLCIFLNFSHVMFFLSCFSFWEHTLVPINEGKKNEGELISQGFDGHMCLTYMFSSWQKKPLLSRSQRECIFSLPNLPSPHKNNTVGALKWSELHALKKCSHILSSSRGVSSRQRTLLCSVQATNNIVEFLKLLSFNSCLLNAQGRSHPNSWLWEDTLAH